MQASPKIVIVEDDLELREKLVQRLSHGFCPIPANDSEELFSILNAEDDVDAILLDVLLPGVDGLAVCRKLREASSPFCDIPVIMLSALGEPTDRVAGLHAGADDYIAKPFFSAELIARINAVLKRCAAPHVRAVNSVDTVRFGEWELNRQLRQMTSKNGVVVMLTQGEYLLLSFFLANPGKPIGREAIARHMGVAGQDLNNINVRIRRLREKLGDSKDCSYIASIRSEGYAWIMPVEANAYA